MNHDLGTTIRWNNLRCGINAAYPGHLSAQRVFIEIDLGQEFKGVFLIVHGRGVKVISCGDLTDLVDNSGTPGIEGPEDLKL